MITTDELPCKTCGTITLGDGACPKCQSSILLDAIEARAEAATPGPWVQGHHVQEPRALCPRDNMFMSLLGLDKDGMAIVAEEADAAFIAHARADVPALVKRVRELERERDLAIAHDRQPYPTAEAYEKACAALNKHVTRVRELEAELARAVEAERQACIAIVQKHHDDCCRCCSDCASHAPAVARAADLLRERGDHKERA